MPFPIHTLEFVVARITKGYCLFTLLSLWMGGYNFD